MKKLILAILFSLFLTAPAMAESLVIQTCGTLPLAYLPGTTRSDTVDINGNKCIAGTFSQTGGTISNATSGQATTSTNQGAVAYLYGFNGTTWDQLQVDASKFLKVNCATGCAGGAFNNNADAVATSATNGQSAAWGYFFNGTTWDRARGDTTNGAFVNVKATVLPPGAGTAANQTTIHNDLVALNTTAGNPLAAQANHTTNVGQVSFDQSTPGTTNAVSPGTIAGGATFVKGTTAAMTVTTSTQILAAVATKVLYVTRVKCNNSSGTATLVQIQDGSAGTVLDTLAAGATYGGEQGTGPTPIFWTTAGNGLFAQNVTTGASVICTASGYSG